MVIIRKGGLVTPFFVQQAFKLSIVPWASPPVSYYCLCVYA